MIIKPNIKFILIIWAVIIAFVSMMVAGHLSGYQGVDAIMGIRHSYWVTLICSAAMLGTGIIGTILILMQKKGGVKNEL
jgi:hypothetical protein